MRVIAYSPDTNSSEQFADLIDRELPEEKFSVEYATSQDDLNQLVSTSDHDAVIVFADEEAKKPYLPISNIDKRNLQGPIITLYKDTSPHALLNALSSGSMVALEFNSVAMLQGALSMAVKNASLGFNGQSQIQTYGALEIDFDNKSVRVNGDKVHFTGKQYDLLAYLVKHSNSLCSKERIFNAIYVHDDDVELKIIDVFICKIRDKLNEAQSGLGDSVETVWGRGYQFTSNPLAVDKRHVKQFGVLEIDLAEQEVRLGEDTVDLTISEFMVLKTFALAFPDNVSRDALMSQVSKFGRDANSDTVDRLLYSVGRKLKQHGSEFEKFIVPVDSDTFLMNVSGLDDKAAKKVEQDITTLDLIKLNRTLKTVTVKREVFDVTDHEMKILDAIMDTFPARITGDALVTAVYGEGGSKFKLNNHLGKLRAKLKEANGGEDLIIFRRGVGYTLNITSDRVMAKFEDQLDIHSLGPWTLDMTRHTLSYSVDDGETSLTVDLNRSQFSVFSAILSAFPNAITKDDLITAVYGDDAQDKDSALNSLYAQMKGVLKTTLGDYASGFRKLVNGTEAFRFDLDIDDIPQDILDQCEVKEVGPWGINKTLDMFMFDGDPIELNDSEYAVVSTFISNYPRPIKTAALAKKHFDGKQPSLNTCLTLLRKKISDTHGITEPFIQNKRGVGYVLVANKDELAQEQVDAMTVIEIGNVSVNMDLGQLYFDDKTVELNAAELFAMKVLVKANKPVTAKLLSEFSKASGQEREPMSMYQAVRSLEDKIAEAGFEGQLIDKRRHAGFFLSTKRDEVVANSNVQHVGGISINKTLLEVGINGVSVALTPSEFKVIETLAENPTIPLSIEDLSKLSDEDGEPFAESTLNLSKNRIKQKLTEAGVDPEDAQIISNKSRVGYYLTPMADNLDKSRLNGKRKTAITDATNVSAGALTINTITDRVEYEGKSLEGVKGKPLDVLVLMAQRHGDFITNEELAEHFFGKPKDDKEKEANLGRVGMGIKSLTHMLDTSVPDLSQSLIMKVGNKGYALTLSMDDRHTIYEKASLPNLHKPTKTKFAKPAHHQNGSGNTNGKINGTRNTVTAAQPQGGGRQSMADQLRDFKLG